MRSFILTLMLGCNGADDTSDTTDTEHTDSPDDTGDTGPVVTGEISGTVLDASGTPIANAYANMCRLICTTVETDAYGAFTFLPLEVGTYSFHVQPPTGQALGQPVVPLTVSDTAPLSVTVKLPALGTPVALPGTRSEVNVGGGLYVTVKQGDLTVAFEDDPTTIAAAVPALDGLPPIQLAGTIKAVWYLEPYEAVADPEVEIRLKNEWGLAANDTVALYTSDYWSFSFVKVGDFTVDANGEWLTSPNDTVAALYTLLLVDEG